MAEIHDDLSETCDLKHFEYPAFVARVCKCLPSIIKAIVPYRGGSILRSILKVQLLKSHVFGQVIVNLCQFRVSCYKFDVKLKLRIFSKVFCELQNDTTIYVQVVGPYTSAEFLFLRGLYANAGNTIKTRINLSYRELDQLEY